MNVTTKEQDFTLNKTSVLHKLGREFQSFNFRDVLPSDLFLPDITVDSNDGLDHEGSSYPHLGPGAGKDLACNSSTICHHLFNSSGLEEVVESSTHRFADTDLWEENDYFAMLNIPAMVFIGILMIFGIVGNTLVVYVYGFRFKPTTQHFLIVCLACLDLLMACIAMPTDIADLRFHHTFSSPAACKLLRFITMFSSTSSSFTLVTIAWDRHKRVTRPLTKQMTLKDAKIWESVNLAAAVFFSWPLLVMAGLRTSETRVHGLYGTDCSFSDTFHGTRWPLYYNSILGFGFIVMVIVLGTLYFQIWKRAKRHRIYMAKRMEKGPISTTSAINEAEGRAAAKNKRASLKDRNLGDQNCTDESQKVVKDVDLCATDNNQWTISPDIQPTKGCENVVVSGTDDSPMNQTSKHTKPYPTDLPFRSDKGFCDELRNTNSPFPAVGEISATASYCLPVAESDKTSCLGGVSEIPVFSPEIRDTNYRFMRSDSVTSEKSPTDDIKSTVTPTVSTNSFRVPEEESNCLINRSNSSVSISKNSMKTKPSKPRRVSLPYILISKPLRLPKVESESKSGLKSLPETSKRSSSQTNGDTIEASSASMRQLAVETDVFDQDKTSFQELEESVGTNDLLKQNIGNKTGSSISHGSSKVPVNCNSLNADNADTLFTSHSPSVLEQERSNTKNMTDDFSLEPFEGNDNGDGSENNCVQFDIDSTNLNVLYCNKNFMYTPASSTNISLSSSAMVNALDQTPTRCQSPTLSIGGESRGRFLSINSISSTCMPASSYGKQTDTTKRASRTIDKTTIVAFAVSIVFVVSFLPYLTLMFVRAFVQDFDYKLQDGTLWLYSSFLRFYLLNSAVNPLLYGWLNERFRAESKRLLCCGLQRKRVPQ